jgi:hypothetical protein
VLLACVSIVPDSHALLCALLQEDAAAAAAAAGAAEELDPEAARDLREQLKQRDAARRAAEAELPWQEVPQPEPGAESDSSLSSSSSDSQSSISED